MASIDYQGAKTEIESIFEKADLQRKIIFWYDAPMNFNLLNLNTELSGICLLD